MNKKTVLSLFVGALFSSSAFSQNVKQDLENYLNKKAQLNEKFWSLNINHDYQQDQIMVKPPFAPPRYSWVELNSIDTSVDNRRDFQTNVSKKSILMSKSILKENKNKK